MESIKKILIADDEAKIAEGIEAYLLKEGYKVIIAKDGQEARTVFDSQSPDMAILDLMLPKISGEEVCKHIRKNSRIPVIMLTAKVLEEDKLNGFAIGADDYITKPFSPRELLARVNSLFRRCADGKPLFHKMSWNDELEIDFENYTVKKSGRIVELTPNEFKILKTLAQNPAVIFSREKLIDAAFGYDFNGFERTIDVHVKNLRGKIEEDNANPRYILTVRGVGYKFGGESSED